MGGGTIRATGVAGAAFVGAAWGGVAALYAAKAAEEANKAKTEANVTMAAQASPSPAVQAED